MLFLNYVATNPMVVWVLVFRGVFTCIVFEMGSGMRIYYKLAQNVLFSIYCIDVWVGDGAVMFWYQDIYLPPSQLSGNSGSTDVVQDVF
jgi:hypothetical protein